MVCNTADPACNDELMNNSFAFKHNIKHYIVAGIDVNEIAEYGVSGLPHHVVVGVDGEVLRNFEVSLPGVVALALTEAEKNTPQASPLSRVSTEFRELE